MKTELGKLIDNMESALDRLNSANASDLRWAVEEVGECWDEFVEKLNIPRSDAEMATAIREVIKARRLMGDTLEEAVERALREAEAMEAGK